MNTLSNDTQYEITKNLSYTDIINGFRSNILEEKLKLDDGIWISLLFDRFNLNNEKIKILKTVDVFEDLTMYQTYEYIDCLICELIDVLEQDFSMVDKRYVNTDNMRDDITIILQKLIVNIMNTSNYDDLFEIIYDNGIKILTILSGLQVEFTGDYDYGHLSFYKMETDCKISSVIADWYDIFISSK
jgi:hypothetical protein